MLQLSQVGVSYSGKSIVEGVGLGIKPGSIQALMGPNGSGKSTLSLALAGHPLYELTKESKVSLDKTDLIPLLPHQRAQAGLFLSFQSPVAIPGVSVKQVMKLMVDQVGKTKVPVKLFLERLKRFATLVGIEDEWLNRSIHEGFSGGEKKRLEMLGLLMASPKYALLDEIDSGLDVDAIKMITKAIRLAQTEFGTGFMIVTHYRRILEYLPVDGVQVMVKGKIVTSGGAELIQRIEADGYRGWE
jgi:Fe-S cluster assembly ATP-binding protein